MPDKADDRGALAYAAKLATSRARGVNDSPHTRAWSLLPHYRLSLLSPPWIQVITPSYCDIGIR